MINGAVRRRWRAFSGSFQCLFCVKHQSMRRQSGSSPRRAGRISSPGFRRRRRVSPRPAASSQSPAAAKSCPTRAGAIAAVLFAIEPAEAQVKDLASPGKLATVLPPGLYRFANEPHERRWPRCPGCSPPIVSGVTRPTPPSRRGSARRKGSTQRGSSASPRPWRFGRDLINTPANDLGPAALEAAALGVAAQFEAASSRRSRGDHLLEAQTAADPRRRARRGRGAAPRRLSLGRRRRTRRSRWSARASCFEFGRPRHQAVEPACC